MTSRIIDGIQENLAKLGSTLYEDSDQWLLGLALLALAVFALYCAAMLIGALIERWKREDWREPSNRRHNMGPWGNDE